MAFGNRTVETSAPSAIERRIMNATPVLSEYRPSAEVVVKFKGNNLRVALNTMLSDNVYLVEVSSALATNEAMRTLIAEAKDAMPKELEALGYVCEGAINPKTKEVSKRDWTNCGNEGYVASAIALLKLGVISARDIPNLWVNFANCGEQVNLSDMGENGKYTVTANGFSFFLIRNCIWLVQYKSPNARGQEYMAPFKWFSNKDGYLSASNIGNLVGMSEARRTAIVDGKNVLTDSYEYSRLYTEGNKIKYRIWSIKVSTGYVDWGSKAVYVCAKYFLPLVCEEGKGLNNMLKACDFNIENNLCRDAVAIETKPLTTAEIAFYEKHCIEFDEVNEAVFAGRDVVPELVFD